MKFHHHRDNDITSGILHVFGIGLSIVALVMLILLAVKQGTVMHVVTFSIFGSGLILLYTISSLYHLIPRRAPRAKSLFQRLDYSMIFIFIAATYTPVCLLKLQGAWGWSIFGVVWGMAIIGVVLKNVFPRMPGWVPAIKYLIMGWIVVIAIVPLWQALSLPALGWIFLGGLFYTVGVIFHGLDKFTPRMKIFGMHEVFHVFVLAGSFSHFWVIYNYLV
ncbi:MAG: hemolysin III family protein [bacterium]|nr:hemolysin III family protein [bacterium]